jgi:hypothetical protein
MLPQQRAQLRGPMKSSRSTRTNSTRTSIEVITITGSFGLWSKVFVALFVGYLGVSPGTALRAMQQDD